MRSLIILLISLSAVTIKCQTILFEAKAAPVLTFPLGKLNEQFWHFSQDSGTYKNIKVKKTILCGAFLSPDLKIVFKSKRATQFLLETGIDYYYQRYKIDWASTYTNFNNSANANAEFIINRQEIGFDILPGMTYKNLNFNIGLKFLFICQANTTRQFLQDSYTLYYSKNNELNPAISIANITLPLFLSYSIAVSQRLRITPFVCYELGIWNFDGYAINWNRRETTMITNLLMGVSIDLCLKNSNNNK